MTTASELFHSRRSRVGRSTTELGSDYALDRNLHHNRRLHHPHRSHDVDDCDPIRRSHHVRHCHRGSPSERESVRIGHGSSQSGSGNNINTETSSSRTSRPRFTRNDRLPGAVLLARERLLERLRGVSLSGNRQSGRTSSVISWDDFPFSDDFRLVDAGDWETETPREWLSGGIPFSDSIAQTDLTSFLQDSSQKKPPGLSKEEVNCLHRMVFKNAVGSEGVIPKAAQECSICLETFQQGDWLVCLPCEHRFHSACIDPWVQTCGDCPYCRTSIAVGDHQAKEKIPSSPH